MESSHRLMSPHLIYKSPFSRISPPSPPLSPTPSTAPPCALPFVSPLPPSRCLMKRSFLQPGDIVAVHHAGSRREGLVVATSDDHLGRRTLEVQLEPTEPLYRTYAPMVTRVKRTVSYIRPTLPQRRSVERYVYW
ncbi:uncharacterized protein C8Q71DRAFT_174134 [Rhodofomes roseus]|uniref:KOW domain-containing protein n=1 Tax=Rhodofomes roseus TaxID=34475 RepID=A0ABQ8K8Y0_9APHY|nr:uncharacterized protein C8Q71DRAFT_174134 [Rhodofomes roseus]KAH9833771.1 hypothetical protein C8Q71DRAFT_174134 [Rhodofomes roseus]